MKYAEPRREHIMQFPSECTPAKLLDRSSPKILHDIVALVALFNHAYTWRYPILFLNATATNVRFAIFAQNWLPWQRPLRYRKRGPDRSSAQKALSCGEKTVKIGPVHPEIFDKIRRATT